MAVITEEAWSVPDPPRQGPPETGRRPVFSDFTNAGYWLDAYEAQNDDAIALLSRAQFPYTETFRFLPRQPEIVLCLLIEPAFRRGIKGNRQPQGHLRTDSCAAIENRRQGFSTHAEAFGSIGNTQSQRLEAEAADYLARMRRIVHLHRHS